MGDIKKEFDDLIADQKRTRRTILIAVIIADVVFIGGVYIINQYLLNEFIRSLGNGS